MRRVNTGISKIRNGKFLAMVMAFLPFLVLNAGQPVQDDHDYGHKHEAATHGQGGEHEKEEFNAANMKSTIMHHISDAHEWHFFTIGETHVTLPLPIILYSKEHGLDIFFSNQLDENGRYGPYQMEHEHISIINEQQDEIVSSQASVMDFSITKNVASMMLSFAILCFVFISVAKAYSRRGKNAPRGFQSFMEPLILFVRDDIAKPNLGHKAERFTPYLLTLFFFIWINNLLGLLPGAANVTGNIAVTVCLALLTLILTNVFGSKDYWGHIFWPPGVPFLVKLILIPVEVVGIVSKPFALLIRLFANITAGHIIIMSILCLIFLFGESGKNIGGGFGVSVAAIPFAIFLYSLELLVAALQAYIFTMLTALFIGQAAESHSEHH